MSLKYSYFFLVIFILNNISSAQSSWKLNPDSMNLAILIVDYDTQIFEKGHLKKYTPCSTCDTLEFPFQFYYLDPGDEGYDGYVYKETGDTVFHGEIIWAGTGRIIYPPESDFLIADSFPDFSQAPTEPNLITYMNDASLDSLYFERVDSIWNKIKTLDIINKFAENPYNVGFYFYTPRVGTFPEEIIDQAKLILFVYQDRLTPENIFYSPRRPNDYTLMLIYPNPFNPVTTINYEISFHSKVELNLYDVLGRHVKMLYSDYKNPGSYKYTLQSSTISSGTYYIQLKTEYSSLIHKCILLK